ncbi:3-deoxy-7-phosphoheptulonate synthase, partial [Micromonospora sp. URMC 106]
RPNYDAESVAGALELLRAAGLPERLVVDASHANSGKNHRNQPKVAADVAAQLAAGQRGIVGIMLESFLLAGRQDLDPTRELTYGRSVTDACIGWETTEEVLAHLA